MQKSKSVTNKVFGALVKVILLLILFPIANETANGDTKAEPTGLDVAMAIDEIAEPADMKAEITMILTNSRGKSRTSKIRMVSMGGAKQQIMWFLSPADDKGVAFLKIEYPDKDDDMRLWLPAFKKVRRISSRKKGDAFMGSDISYEDMTTRNIAEYDYTLLGRESVEGADCYILESIPKTGVESSYNRIVTWIDVENYTARKEETYDDKGKLLKKRTIKQIDIKSYTLPGEIFVENVQKEHTTMFIFENIEVDTGVEENLFQEKNLKRLPR